MNEQQSALDAFLAAAGWNITKGSAVATGVSWLLSSQGAATVGIVGVIAGLAMQWYFGRRRDRREEAQAAREKQEHELRMTQANVAQKAGDAKP